MATRGRQLALPVRATWGGRRKGAGRKPGPRPIVLHRARAEHKSRFPLHVTLRARADVGSLRGARLYPTIEAAIAAGSRSVFRIVHFSVQGDHMHLIVEARDKTALSMGVRGLMIRVARALNRAAGRSGPVWADRYHARDLRSPREVRNALCYVLLNARKHAQATCVAISVAADTNRLHCRVADDGRGFDKATWDNARRDHHMGLDATGERVRMAGGEFAIESEPAGGTRASFSLPIHHAQAA